MTALIVTGGILGSFALVYLLAAFAGKSRSRGHWDPNGAWIYTGDGNSSHAHSSHHDCGSHHTGGHDGGSFGGDMGGGGHH